MTEVNLDARGPYCVDRQKDEIFAKEGAVAQRLERLAREGNGRMSNFYQNINPLDGYNVLRIICGAFFIPHIYAKFFVPAALDFFVAAKFQPPAFWMYVAGAIETVLAIGLILGIFPTLVGAVAAIHLTVAAAAVYRVTGGKWLWNIGGYEYCAFWAISCVVVAMHG